jgi:hypothetical protein
MSRRKKERKENRCSYFSQLLFVLFVTITGIS